jgi:hypothetical protein
VLGGTLGFLFLKARNMWLSRDDVHNLLNFLETKLTAYSNALAKYDIHCNGHGKLLPMTNSMVVPIKLVGMFQCLLCVYNIIQSEGQRSQAIYGLTLDERVADENGNIYFDFKGFRREKKERSHTTYSPVYESEFQTKLNEKWIEMTKH